jgi:hypothetical protein
LKRLAERAFGRRWLIIGGLTGIIAAVGAGIAAWPFVMAPHEKRVQEARQTEIRETLGKFIDEGQVLENAIVASPTAPVEKDKIADWIQRTANFLQTLGPSYVTRFTSSAGLESALSPGASLDPEHVGWWNALRIRLTRLHEFSAEFSGQIR